MKLIRVGQAGHEKPGVLIADGRRLNVSSFCEDFDERFFGSDGVQRLATWLDENADSCPIFSDEQRLGAPIARPSKLICIGLNYAKHAEEGGMAIPEEPVIFFKATSSICGPFDDVIIPRDSSKTDWEVELAFVIGNAASYVEQEEAMGHVAGYLVHNDVSEREFQLERGGQWVKGKSCDTFAPLGPYLVSADDVPDPHNLNLWLKVNDVTLQSSNTSDMVFGIPELVSYLSRFMTLLPGDVISTGTPAGVGLGLKPPRYLNHGDIMELGVDGLGISRQRAVNYQAPK